MTASLCIKWRGMVAQADEGKTPLQVALEHTKLPDVELAFRIGVNVTTIWRWRSGKSSPSSRAIRAALAEVLGRSVDELWPHGP
jgi:transcriptional regulator with XRE-family HTH domain